VDSGDRFISGNWTQGDKALPLTLDRANAQTAAAKEADIEEQKDYSHTGPNDLPGHWQGTLEVKEAGVKLRLGLNIAKLPDGKFSCSMVSIDQGGAEIPASAIEYAPPNVRVEWSSIGASYNGKLENGKLTGAFRQGGAALPLVFERNRTQ
jgi:hypothetical protein